MSNNIIKLIQNKEHEYTCKGCVFEDDNDGCNSVPCTDTVYDYFFIDANYLTPEDIEQ